MLGRNDFIDTPFLGNTITDTHFAERTRQGRLVAFLARMRTDWNLTGRGIGVSEKTAVGIGPNGMAQVFGKGVAYFAAPTTPAGPEQCAANKPLIWLANKRAIRVTEIQGTTTGSGTFNLATWTVPPGAQTMYWSVDAGVFQAQP